MTALPICAVIQCVGCDELKLKQLGVRVVNPAAINRSGANTAYLTMRRGYRKTSGVLQPVSRGNSFITPTDTNLSRSLQDMFFTAAQNGGAMIAPFWRNPTPTNASSTTKAIADLPTLFRNCHRARLVSQLPTIQDNANDDVFGGSLTFGELP